MDSFSKQPAETFLIAVEFSGSLDSSETIVEESCSASAVNLLTGEADTDVVEDPVKDGTILNVRVKAGVSGTNYKITVTAVTDGSSTYEKDITMIVEDE